jgi:hypothetical protein
MPGRNIRKEKANSKYERASELLQMETIVQLQSWDRSRRYPSYRSQMVYRSGQNVAVNAFAPIPGTVLQ